jgi:hypothetical protein
MVLQVKEQVATNRKHLAANSQLEGRVITREKHVGGPGGSLEPPGHLPMHLHVVHMAYYGCLPTLLTPLAERTCLSQVIQYLIYYIQYLIYYLIQYLISIVFPMVN